jgi:hypothetical protein
MKILLFIPSKYSINHSLQEICDFRQIIWKAYDYRKFIGKSEKKINTQVYRLPYNLREKWNKYFFQKVNKWYKNIISKEIPDAIFIYNNEMFLPSTLKWVKTLNVRIFIFLGDNPLYTHTNDYNLSILEIADQVFASDTYWKYQLSKLGFSHIDYILMPLPKKQYHKIDNLEFKYDAYYKGMSYKNSWGYKKSKFLSYFTDFNLLIQGNDSWRRWLSSFPELENCIDFNSPFLSVQELNEMYNISKLIPVDGNPGLFYGIHSRVREALAAETLPIMEYNKDIDFIFEGINDLPAVKDYRQIPEMASWYIKNDNQRKIKINEMKMAYNNTFSIESVSGIILNNL